MAPKRTSNGHACGGDTHEMVIVAVDDGHNDTKCIVRKGNDIVKIRFESNAKPGSAALAGLSGEVVSDVYETGGQRYTVAPRRLLSDGLDTRTADFPLSPFNRILVAHALKKIGLDETSKVSLATGLPLKEWIAENRESRIEQKISNIAEPVKSLDGWQRPEIVSQIVLPEALSAYMHGVTSGLLESDKSVAIVDIGGRTMDIAIIKVDRGKPMIDRARSGSEEIGALNIRDRLRSLMVQKFELDVVDEMLIDQAMDHGEILLFNRKTDCRDLINNAVNDVKTQAMNAAKHRIGKGAELQAVWLVGGGSQRIDLREAWPHSLRVDEPEFANAMGMLKRLEQVKASA